MFRVYSQITKIFIPFEDFGKLPPMESITRVRRKIQNEDKHFVATDKMVLARRSREKTFAKWGLNIVE